VARVRIALSPSCALCFCKTVRYWTWVRVMKAVASWIEGHPSSLCGVDVALRGDDGMTKWKRRRGEQGGREAGGRLRGGGAGEMEGMSIEIMGRNEGWKYG
jgi:hypothetical protein